MTIKELKEAFVGFPDDIEVRIEAANPEGVPSSVVEINEPGTPPHHNYLLLS